MSYIGTVRNINGDVVDVKPNSNTGNNEFLVNMEGHECADNSTTTPLLADQKFTGADWQDGLDYGMLTVTISTDQDSAIDGLDIQWSSDAVNIQGHDTFTVLGGYGKTFSFGLTHRYWRLVYTNGSEPQGEFNLTSLLKRNYVKPSSHRIGDAIVGEDDAELVKAVLSAEDQNNIFQNIRSDLDGNLRVNSLPYTYAIAEGTILDHSPLLKFGTRISTTAGADSTVWEGNTSRYVYMETAQKVKVSSSSSLDTLLGDGMRKILLLGLDANYNEISEEIPLNGTGVVETQLEYLRVFRAFGTEVGSFGAENIGKITITNNAGTTEQLVINTGDGQTLMTMWTVPAGKVGFLTNGSFSTNSNKGATVSVVVRQLDGGVYYPWLIKYRAFLFSGNENFPFTIPFKIPEKTDVEVRVQTPISAGLTSVGATFEMWYEDITAN